MAEDSCVFSPPLHHTTSLKQTDGGGGVYLFCPVSKSHAHHPVILQSLIPPTQNSFNPSCSLRMPTPGQVQMVWHSADCVLLLSESRFTAEQQSEAYTVNTQTNKNSKIQKNSRKSLRHWYIPNSCFGGFSEDKDDCCLNFYISIMKHLHLRVSLFFYIFKDILGNSSQHIHPRKI